ncbi:Telomere length regulator protein rif1 [Apiospora arundinis]
MADYTSWDVRPGDGLNINLDVGNDGIFREENPLANLPDFFYFNSGNAEGAQYSLDLSLFIPIETTTPQPGYPLPWEYGEGARLQGNPGFQLPPGPSLRATVNPWDTYYVEGGQSSPPPRPPLSLQTPSDLTGEGSSPCPSTPSSSQSSPEPQHPCKVCGKRFKKSNDSKRHTNSVHGKRDQNINRYRCSCGYTNARKDNYLRHHYGGRRQRQWCNRVAEHVSPDHPFVCCCGAADCSASAHLQHVTQCTLGHHGPSGRPRRRSLA